MYNYTYPTKGEHHSLLYRFNETNSSQERNFKLSRNRTCVFFFSAKVTWQSFETAENYSFWLEFNIIKIAQFQTIEMLELCILRNFIISSVLLLAGIQIFKYWNANDFDICQSLLSWSAVHLIWNFYSL